MINDKELERINLEIKTKKQLSTNLLCEILQSQKTIDCLELLIEKEKNDLDINSKTRNRLEKEIDKLEASKWKPIHSPSKEGCHQWTKS